MVQYKIINYNLKFNRNNNKPEPNESKIDKVFENESFFSSELTANEFFLIKNEPLSSTNQKNNSNSNFKKKNPPSNGKKKIK